MTDAPDGVATAITAVARSDGGRLVAVLASRLGLDLADEALQDAYAEAVVHWRADGVPANPAGWLLSVARRKAIDRLRRAASAHRRTLDAAPELIGSTEPAQEVPSMSIDQAGIDHDELRMIMLCCHPALGEDAQLALTLRLVGGLTTTEIAAGLLRPEATVGQRISRAKTKIRAAGIPLVVPADLGDRVEVALRVIYLIFNEGYLSRSPQPMTLRVDLLERADTLARRLAALVPGHREARALVALIAFHRARTDARLDPDGELVLLPDQDRTRWDRSMIDTGNRLLAEVFADPSLVEPGPFLLQAIIAGCHANAPTAEATDWPAVVAAYDRLLALTGSPVVAVNRAVAVAHADGPLIGLRMLDAIDGLEGYHLLPAARGELYARLGDRPAAIEALRLARSLARQPAEQRHLDRRIADLS